MFSLAIIITHNSKLCTLIVLIVIISEMTFFQEQKTNETLL